MKIIDRYLLRTFAWYFMGFFVSLTGMCVIFDAFSNLDEFQRFAEKRGDMLAFMGEFYAYRSIYFFDRMSGVLTMVTAMFTVTWIQRHQELTALMAAGISRWRVIRPVILAAIAVSLGTAASRELLIPRVREQLAQSPKDLGGEMAQELKPRYDNETGVLFRGKQSFANEQKIVSPSFILPEGLDSLGKQLAAENAYYRKPTAEHPGGYLLKGVTQPLALAKSPSLSLEGRPIVITPLDRPEWLSADECFVATEVNFEQLRGGVAWRQFSSTPELIEGLSNRSLDFGADVRVAIHARLLQPLADVTLLFLGLPLMLRRENRNVFLAIGLCGLVTGAFMLVSLGSQKLGMIYLLDPIKAAWLPLVIFVPIATWMFEGIRR